MVTEAITSMYASYVPGIHSEYLLFYLYKDVLYKVIITLLRVLGHREVR